VSLKSLRVVYTERLELKAIRLLMLVCLILITAPFYRPTLNPVLNVVQTYSNQHLSMFSSALLKVGVFSLPSFQFNQQVLPTTKKNTKVIRYARGADFSLLKAVNIQRSLHRYGMGNARIKSTPVGFKVMIPGVFSKKQSRSVSRNAVVNVLFRPSQ
jgi:hypothetical protein